MVAALALLAVCTAVITGLGAGLTPAYGDLPQYQESGIVDVHSTPQPLGWTTDLARSIVPGVPVRCVSFSASSSGGSLVLLTGLPLPLGSSSNCSSLSTDQVESTIALLDTATGRVLWAKDLRSVYPDNAGSVVLQQSAVAPAAKTVVIQVVNGSQTAVAGLSLATGAVTGSVEHPTTQGQTPEVAGSLVLFAGSTSRTGATRWTLANAATPDRPVWSAILPDYDQPRMTDRAVFTTLGSRSVRIDGETGRITTMGDGAVDLSDSLDGDDGLFTNQVVPSGTVVSAWSADGTELWSRSGVGALSGVSRGCVMVALTGTTQLTCLDRATGARRWTTQLASLTFASSMPGQTTDDVAVYQNSSRGIRIVLLDGSTGGVEYEIPLDAVTSVVSFSRTTGYLRTTSDSGSSTGMAAFDTRTGAILWRRSTTTNDDTELWGGHLVSIRDGHVARELGQRPALILGD